MGCVMSRKVYCCYLRHTADVDDFSYICDKYDIEILTTDNFCCLVKANPDVIHMVYNYCVQCKLADSIEKQFVLNMEI